MSSFPFPANTATANRVRFLSNTLKKIDEVNIFSSGIDDLEKSNSQNLKGERIAPKKSKNLIVRGFFELLFLFHAGIKLLNTKDFVLMTIPSPLLIFVAYVLRRENYAIDVRDCTWEYLNNGGCLLRTLSKVYVYLGYRAFQRAKVVICTNKLEAESIKRSFLREPEIIPNGIEIEKFEAIRAEAVESNLSQSSRPKILYL